MTKHFGCFAISNHTTIPTKEVSAMTTNQVSTSNDKFKKKRKRRSDFKKGIADCIVPGCNGKERSLGYCNRHYEQVRKFGCVQRTKYDFNEIVILGNLCLVVLRDKNNDSNGIAIVDKKDYGKVKQYRWCVAKSLNVSYVATSTINKQGKRTTLRLHQLIMKSQKGQIIDHINRNGLDNRKMNLRFCTPQQNCWNSKKRNGKSLYKGVCWRKDRNKWRVYLNIDKYKRKYIGSFDNQEAAAIAYNKACLFYRKEFARINLIQKDMGI